MIEAHITHIEQATPTIKRIRLKTQQAFEFLPGQWIDLSVEGTEKLGGYSITSAPKVGSNEIELAIKHSQSHPVTQCLWNQTEPGLKLKISEAQGGCTFRPELGKKIILIAGGIGITPMMSMFRHIRDLKSEIQVALIYSASSPDEFVFNEEIRKAANENDHVLAVFSCTDEEADLPDWIHFQEHVDRFFLKTMNLPQDAHYFICGPEKMLEDIENSLIELQVGAGNIHYERW